MKRGRTERETCDLNGWAVGTILRGWDGWSEQSGCWCTIRITAIGEDSMLARCIKHESIDGDRKNVTDDHDCENTWTLSQRDWSEAQEPTP